MNYQASPECHIRLLQTALKRRQNERRSEKAKKLAIFGAIKPQATMNCDLPKPIDKTTLLIDIAAAALAMVLISTLIGWAR